MVDAHQAKIPTGKVVAVLRIAEPLEKQFRNAMEDLKVSSIGAALPPIAQRCAMIPQRQSHAFPPKRKALHLHA